ncbi:MAG: 16S rRNA (guanine(966)-N(2))-methyltransferase RsmD [Mariprofundaceae bacterium]|nr:16S rRNA (guanine(966)-N(2))-methyltransferase RsmD [Mariprofundaceae bacterium]
MRITAGRFRGRNLPIPKHAGVRPTPSKVRQALFNILGNIEGACVLDLFSGSGLMALEALSRGAVAITSVEKNRRIFTHLQNIRGNWEIQDEWQLLHGDVQGTLPRLAGRHFDLVFADPPYAQGISEYIPCWLDDAHISCRQLVIEESARVDLLWPSGWTQAQLRRYGDTCLYFLEPEAA